jgi:acetolactate decarboxylase
MLTRRVDHLGGEVVIVDGEAIECTLDGPPVAMDDDDILPFAIVCRRRPDAVRRDRRAAIR